jgi:hypothetical protein
LHTRLRWRNIGCEGRKKRRIYGLLTLGAIAALLLWHAVVPDLAWVLGVGFLAWSAALCLLQARAGICVFHATLGMVDFGRGPTPIRSSRVKSILRRHALRLHLLAAISWGVATSLSAVAKI